MEYNEEKIQEILKTYTAIQVKIKSGEVRMYHRKINQLHEWEATDIFEHGDQCRLDTRQYYKV